jgi:hypothetical protein
VPSGRAVPTQRSENEFATGVRGGECKRRQVPCPRKVIQGAGVENEHAGGHQSSSSNSLVNDSMGTSVGCGRSSRVSVLCSDTGMSSSTNPMPTST